MNHAAERFLEETTLVPTRTVKRNVGGDENESLILILSKEKIR
jgi:hypothetical protein